LRDFSDALHKKKTIVRQKLILTIRGRFCWKSGYLRSGSVAFWAEFAAIFTQNLCAPALFLQNFYIAPANLVRCSKNM
jgi:hypothetical protein